MSLAKAFQELVQWSEEEHSDLPWRQEIRPIYEVLVAEIMLQQTTVGTVLPRYKPFLKAFPTSQSLANASEDELRIAWQGLGYYRRAKNLKSSCSYLAENNDTFPESIKELVAIAGIGPYTASALLSIGLDLAELAVDGNLKRVLSRVFLYREEYGEPLTKKIRLLLEDKAFAKMLKACGSRKVNEALMDLGREICSPRNAKCLVCPLSKICAARKEDCIEELPVKPEKKAKQKSQTVNLLRVLVQNEAGEYLIYQKEKGEWLEGQWEFPSFRLDGDEDANFAKQYAKAPGNNEAELFKLQNLITRYRINNSVIASQDLSKFKSLLKNRKLAFYSSKKANQFPLSTTCRKILQRN